MEEWLELVPQREHRRISVGRINASKQFARTIRREGVSRILLDFTHFGAVVGATPGWVRQSSAPIHTRFDGCDKSVGNAAGTNLPDLVQRIC
jgi:hypothetical protein